MPYMSEEIAVLEGLIGAYFASPHISEGLRSEYITVYRHIEDGQLTRADYQRIRSAVDLLLPLHRSSPSEYKLLVGVLTKTTSMLCAS
ncbi:MAG: hypothetical protein J5449_08490 [Oscillospiraceae bacterium]|nr:hypothetical protein [Oscillospiraceae bacterium]